MHRFFLDRSIALTDRVVIIDSTGDVNHIKRALRVKIGEKLELCDAKGDEYIVEVDAIDEVVSCTILEEVEVNRESNIAIDLFQGLAKGCKMETIIQKAVELGVRDVFPTDMHRSIVKLDHKSEKKKVERWQKIADEAAKQSKRSYIPVVHPVIQLKTLKDLSDYDLILIAYEKEDQSGLRAHINSFDGQKIAVFIGPEGGFEEEEVDQLIALGGHSVTLGKRIVRTETAGMMLLSILQYGLGDIS